MGKQKNNNKAVMISSKTNRNNNKILLKYWLILIKKHFPKWKENKFLGCNTTVNGYIKMSQIFWNKN